MHSTVYYTACLRSLHNVLHSPSNYIIIMEWLASWFRDQGKNEACVGKNVYCGPVYARVCCCRLNRVQVSGITLVYLCYSEFILMNWTTDELNVSPPLGPSTAHERMCCLEQVFLTPASGTIMLASTRSSSFSNMTPGGNSDLYYSPPPAQMFGIKANTQPFLMSESSTLMHQWTTCPPTLAIEDTNVRRGEHMNSVSSMWSMVLLLLWSCPQVEDGARLLRLHSRDSQVSSPRNMTNHTAAL